MDIFKPMDTNYLFCTENVKEYCMEKEYTNIIFLEVGEIE
jgi:hypothetical protein